MKQPEIGYLPPLRRYKQMVRVVKQGEGSHLAKKSVAFKLGNAFGDPEPEGFDSMFSDNTSPVVKQMKTLATINALSESYRGNGLTQSGGLLPTRSGSTLYHDLNDTTQDYLNGMSDDIVLSRHEANAGTKFRTELSPTAANKIVYQQDAFSGHSTIRGKGSSSLSHTHFHSHESHFPEGYNKARMHRYSSHSGVTFS